MPRQDFASQEAGPIRFAYPSNWRSEPADSEDGLCFYLQSPGVTFGIFGVYPEEMEPEDLIEQAVETLREEHPSLEVEETFDAEWPDSSLLEAVFMSLDTVSYCWLRSWRAEEHTLFVLVQSIDAESKASEAIFQAICRSVTAL